ncbi:hypothetical protein RQP46_001349 [Phenoliferia psychrophenolica]
MSSNTVAHHLVVGASRGIGYALVEELLKQDSTSIVIATVRDAKKAPEALTQLGEAFPGRLIGLELDMVKEPTIKAAAEELSKHTQSLTSLNINGGVSLGVGPIQDLDSAHLLTNIMVNCVGPHNILRTFSPFLLASTDAKRSVVIISSAWAESLMPQGIAVALVHPGNVVTDMNPAAAKDATGITPEVSAKGIVSVIGQLDVGTALKGLISYDGTILPW